jgi:hypothetical protein
MAGEELFGAAEVGIGGIRIAVAGGKENFGDGYEEDLAYISTSLYEEKKAAHVMLHRRALAGESATEEGPQVGIQDRRHSIGI